MAWCRQSPSHYLSQCWLRSMSPYGTIRPQWVKSHILTAIPLLSHLSSMYTYTYRDQSRYARSQWEASLQCNNVSHWLGAYLDWSLHIHLKIFLLTCSFSMIRICSAKDWMSLVGFKTASWVNNALRLTLRGWSLASRSFCCSGTILLRLKKNSTVKYLK